MGKKTLSLTKQNNSPSSLSILNHTSSIICGYCKPHSLGSFAMMMAKGEQKWTSILYNLPRVSIWKRWNSTKFRSGEYGWGMWAISYTWMFCPCIGAYEVMNFAIWKMNENHKVHNNIDLPTRPWNWSGETRLALLVFLHAYHAHVGGVLQQ